MTATSVHPFMHIQLFHINMNTYTTHIKHIKQYNPCNTIHIQLHDKSSRCWRQWTDAPPETSLGNNELNTEVPNWNCCHVCFIIGRSRSHQAPSKNPPTPGARVCSWGTCVLHVWCAPVLSSGFTSTRVLLKLDFKIVKIDLLNMKS